MCRVNSVTATDRPVRRTQSQRREQTRSALIEATIATIEHSGFHAATNRAIVDRAGASLGAMSHQFAGRNELIAAALDEVGRRAVTELARRAAALGDDGPPRTAQLLDLLWQLFDGNLFQVWVKVWSAAADDPELYATLAPNEEQLSTAIAAVVADLTPHLAGDRTWSRRLGVAIDTMRGLALAARFEPHRADRARDRWPSTRAELVRLIDG